jgi:predicted CXXCH cytochrome family protein
VLATAAVVLFVRAWLHSNPFPLPPITPSPFLNTKAGVAYVGTATCISCHKDEHASFCRTGMGSSMTEVDPASAPPDGGFDHPLSKRRYRAYRKDGEFWHRESLLSDGPEEVVLAEYPLKYAVGSGRHALTYLVETDGFLVESPMSWYASRKAWDISPGYDDPKQPGFARAIGEGCLFCHAGHAEAIGRSTHHMRISETTIGCERCHGPGALHVDRQAKPQGAGGAIDYTIVNPAHLSRDLAEAICQQCHLNSDATVTLRGRKLTDYRPGLRLEEFREVFLFKELDQSMTVVGHVEQMHQSRCYQAADTFSCLTCHDPHGEPAPNDRTAHYKTVCTSCHRPQSCTVSAAVQKKQSPDNDCVVCHMPRSPTDIPHLAFTHHRVGIYRAPPVAGDDPPREAAELQPFLPLPALSEIDRKLALGEAYRLLPLRSKHAGHKAEYQRRALDLLTAVHDAGLKDGDLEAGLAQLCFDMKAGDPFAHAERALAFPDLAGQSRCDALFVKAQILAERGNHADAVVALRALTQLRRYTFDWLYLANYSRALGDQTAAHEALDRALRINPRQWDAHRYLAEHYRQEGDAERAAWHERRAVP